MTSPLRLALCVLILVLGIGCTNVRSTVSIGTQRFEEVPREKTYSFDTSALRSGSKDHELYYAQIEACLKKFGWKRLPNDDEGAEYSLDFSYSPVRNHMPSAESPARARQSSMPPISVGERTRTSTTTTGSAGTRYSSPAPQSSGNIAMTSFSYKMELDMVLRVTGGSKRRLVSMWEASVYAGSAATDGRQVIPVMIDVLFKKFPGKPDYKYVITSPVKD